MDEVNIMVLQEVIILVVDAFIITFICMQVISQKLELRQIVFLSVSNLSLIVLLDYMYFIRFSSVVIEIIFMVLLISFITNQNYKTSFLSCISGLCIYVWIEDISTHIALLLSGLKSLNIENSVIMINISYWIAKIITLIIVAKFLKRLNIEIVRYFSPQRYSNTKCNMRIDKDFKLLLSIILLVYLITCFSSKDCLKLIDCLAFDKFKHMIIPNQVFKIFVPLLIIAIVAQIIFTINEREKWALQADNLKYIEDLVNTNRAQRHDFNHDLQVIYGLMQMKAFDRAEEYIKKNIDEIAEVSEVFKTDNKVLTALLHMKNCIAASKDIKLNVEVRSSFMNMPISDKNLVIVLGNLIDNAIDEVDEKGNTHKTVWVILDSTSKDYILEVMNYNHSARSLDNKIFLPGVTTKRTGKGMGLYSVKRSVNKNKGKIFFGNNDEYIFFRVTFPKEKRET